MIIGQLFRYAVLRLRRYERKLIENRRFRRNGVNFAQFQYKPTKCRPPQTILCIAKLDRSKWTYFLYRIRRLTEVFVLSQFTRLTDGRTAFSWIIPFA